MGRTGMTLIEKLLSARAGRRARVGDVVWVDLDVRSARDFGGASVVAHLEREYEAPRVADPARTFFTFDCNAPANTTGYAENQHRCRLFARREGIRVFDVDRGIGSHVMLEEGLAVPGTTVVGTDSHLNVLGAVGAFGQGMGDQDIAFAFRTGRTWFEVPPSMRVVLAGHPPEGTTAKDVTLAVLDRLGSRGALGRAIEFVGEAAASLDLAGRITLASMVTEMGGIIGFLEPDEAVLRWCRERSGRADLSPIGPDPDASYVEEVVVDLSGLEPLLACPPRPDNVKPVRAVAGRTVDSVFIGSCTNGRRDDIEAVARLVRRTGRRVAPHVVASVVPATREVFGELLRNGTLDLLHEAGFIVSNPGCGGCASGQIGMTGTGEVQVSTSNRNFRGKQGNGETYLASPETAAACALLGRIGTAGDL